MPGHTVRNVTVPPFGSAILSSRKTFLAAKPTKLYKEWRRCATVDQNKNASMYIYMSLCACERERDRNTAEKVQDCTCVSGVGAVRGVNPYQHF